MANCEGCGAEMPDGARFCPACGHPHSQSLPAMQQELAHTLDVRIAEAFDARLRQKEIVEIQIATEAGLRLWKWAKALGGAAAVSLVILAAALGLFGVKTVDDLVNRLQDQAEAAIAGLAEASADALSQIAEFSTEIAEARSRLEELSQVEEDIEQLQARVSRIEGAIPLGSDFDLYCIHSSNWVPYGGEAHAQDDRGCWQLHDWGFSPETDTETQSSALHILGRARRPYTEETLRWIHSAQPLPLTSDLRFTLRVDVLDTVAETDTELLFGVAPPSSSAPSSEGLYFLFARVRSVQGSPVYLKIRRPDGAETSLPIQYSIGQTHRITLRFADSAMSVFIDGDQVAGPVDIPFEEMSFWLGYRMWHGATLDAYVSGFSLEEQLAP